MKTTALRKVFIAGVFAMMAFSLWPNVVAAQSTQYRSSNPYIPDSAYKGVVDPRDGSMYIGGYFAEVGYDGQAAIVNRDDARPHTGIPRVDGYVFAALPDGSGGWYIGGSFTHVGSYTRNRLAHILADGSVDPNWNPNADNEVFALAYSPDQETIYVAGRFSTLGSDPGGDANWRRGIGAISAEDGSRLAWNPNGSKAAWGYDWGDFNGIVVTNDTVYVAGTFGQINGFIRSAVAALDPSTGTLKKWGAGVMSKDVASGTVNSLRMGDQTQTLYLGGNFFGTGTASQAAAIHAVTGEIEGATSPEINAIGGGRVNAVIPDGSGGWYLGGTFSVVGTTSQPRLAHVDANGNLDLNWRPTVDGGVNSLVLVGSTLYVSGDFTHIGEDNAARNRLAAVDTGTGNATSWNPNANNWVGAMAYDAGAGILYVGGGFTGFGATTRNHIASFTVADGNLTSWDPNVNDNVYAIAVGNGAVYFGGGFGTVGGTGRTRLAKVNATTAELDDAWAPTAGSDVYTMILDGDAVRMGGSFTSISGTGRNYAAAVDAADGSLLAWNPNANGQVYTMLKLGNRVYLGGPFTTMAGTERYRLAAVSASSKDDAGALDSWAPRASQYVMTLSTDGTKIYAGGLFNRLSQYSHMNVVRIGVNAEVDQVWRPHEALTWSFSQNGQNVYVVTPDEAHGNVYIGGEFTQCCGWIGNREKFAEVSATGTGELHAWAPQPDSTVRSIHVRGDRLYIGGGFGNIGGVARSTVVAYDLSQDHQLMSMNFGSNGWAYTVVDDGTNVFFSSGAGKVKWGRSRLVKILANGSVDWDFPELASGTVQALQILGNKLYVGGSTWQQNLKCIDLDTKQFTAWNSQLDGTVNTLFLDGTKLYVGGRFWNASGQARDNLARYELSSGTPVLDATWSPSTNGNVSAILLRGDWIYISGGSYGWGSFNTVNGVGRNNLARIHKDTGALDLTWNPGTNGEVYTMALDGNRLYVGGAFTQIQAVNRNLLAALEIAEDGSTTVLDSWTPEPNRHIDRILPVGDIVYVTGYFDQIKGQARGYIVGLTKSDATLLPWSPVAGEVRDVMIANGDLIAIGSPFTVNGVAQNGFARFGLPTIAFSAATGNGLESVSPVQIPVSLDGVIADADVSVDYAVTGGTATVEDFALASGTLTIPAGQLSANIEMTIAEDQFQETPETVVVTLSNVSVSTAKTVVLGTTSSFTYTITDNDTAGVTVTPSGGTTVVAEGGATDTYTIALNSEPTAEVTIEMMAPAGFSVSPEMLTFNDDDWSEVRTVTVSAIEDQIAKGNQSGDITHVVISADGNYSGIDIANVSVTSTDNDTAAISITGTDGSTVVKESGTTDTYTVALQSRPEAPITVTITNADASRVRVAPTSLSFTQANWNTAQTVTITGLSDAEAHGSHTVRLTHTATGDDAQYQNKTASLDVLVNDDTVPAAPVDNGNTGGNGNAPTCSGTPISLPSSAQTVNAGVSVILDGSRSSGTELSYRWSVISGNGAVASPTAAQTAFSSAGGVSVIELTVTDRCGISASARTQITVVAQEQVRGEVVQLSSIGSIGSMVIYENRIGDQGMTRFAVTINRARLLLPTSVSEYTVLGLRNNAVVIGMAQAFRNEGVVLVSTRSIAEYSGAIDVTSILSRAQQGIVSEVDGFLVRFGNRHFGENVSISDLNHDGSEEIVVSDRTNAGASSAVIMNSELTPLTRLVTRNSETIGTVQLANLTSRTSSDVLVGPTNPAMNSTLTRRNEETAQYVDAVRVFSSETVMNSTENVSMDSADVTLGQAEGVLYRSAAYGDLNGDTVSDVVMISNAGETSAYYGPFEQGEVRTAADADLTVVGTPTNSEFGASVAIADMSGDGIGDIVIGDPAGGDGEEGAVYVIYGSTTPMATLDLTSATVVMGETALDRIGADLLMIEEGGVAVAYTLKGDEDVYRIAIDTADVSTPGDTGAEVGGVELQNGGGGCSLASAQATVAPWALMLLAIVLLLAPRGLKRAVCRVRSTRP